MFTSAAEKRKSKPKPPGSAKLKEARLQHLLWRIVCKGLKNRRRFTERLNQIARKLKISEKQEEWNQLKEVATNLRQANELRKKLDKEAFTLKAMEREENTVKNIPEHRNKESALQEIAHRMRQKFQFQQIRESVRNTMSGGIAHIIHPEPFRGYRYQPEEVEQWNEEHDQETLKKIILERNSVHFRQAVGTFFTTEAMLEALPFTANSRLPEDILEGKYVSGPTLEATQILKECSKMIEPDEGELMLEEIQSCFWRWDDKTSTSPSGIHLGMYKCLTDLSEQKEEKLT